MGKNKFMHEDIGFNYRLPNVSAAMGLGQFNQISEFLNKERIDSRYRKNLKDVKVLIFQPLIKILINTLCGFLIYI